MIEHHGGPKRLVRVSATVRPSTSVVWIEALLGLTSGCLGMLRFFAPAMLLGALFCVLWLAAVWHANCLELAIVVNMAEVAEELQLPGLKRLPPETLRREIVRAPVAGD